MRIVSCFLSGFIAVCAATAGSPTSTPNFNDAFDTVLPPEPAQADGHWRIGCDEHNYCSYFHDAPAATDIPALRSARADSIQDIECQGCTDDKPCSACQPFAFKCADCRHFECAHDSMNTPTCVDVLPQRFTKSNATTAFTRSNEFPNINATSLTGELDMGNDRHVGGGQNMSLPADTHPLFGRHAAFSGDQCVDCDSSECPECHNDCQECQHFKCVDPVSRLSMCMSVRPKYLVPCDPVPPPISIVTKTVYFLPVSTPISASTITIKPTPRSVAAAASSIPPSVMTVSTVVTKTTTVYTPAPSKSTTTEYIEVSIIPVSRSPISSPSAPVTKTIVIASKDRSIVPRARFTNSSDASRTMTNVARATRVSEPVPHQQYNVKEASCRVCKDASDCKGCEFVCPECGGHMLCDNPYSGSYLCVEILGNLDAPEIHNAFIASDQALGYAASLLIPQDANAIIATNSSDSVQAIVKGDNKTVLSFNATYCRACSHGDPACSGCKWKFMCSEKTKCSTYSENTALEICHEKAQLCAD